MDLKNYQYLNIGSKEDLDLLIENIKNDYETVLKDTKKYGEKKYRPEYVEKLKIKVNWRFVTWLGAEDLEKLELERAKKGDKDNYL